MSGLSSLTLLFLLAMILRQKVNSYQPISLTVHHTSTAIVYKSTIVSNVQTLPAQSNIMPTRTSLVLYTLPTSTIQGTKSLPSVQPSSTERVLPSVQPSSTERVLRMTKTIQPMPPSSRASRPRNSESFWPMLGTHSTASVPTESSRLTRPTGSSFITLNLQTIAIIAGAGAFVTTTCILTMTVAACACTRNKSRKRHVKRGESMIGNSAYGTTVENRAAVRTYRPGDTYDYPRFGLQLLKSVRPDNTYTTVTTFTAQKSEAYATSPPGSEDFEDNMQTNEAYVATPTSTRDFEHSMQINEAYVATPTSVNGSLEQHSMQYRDDEIYENYVTNTNKLDEYSYVRYVHR